MERSFADAKQLHGHRYARMRGLKKVDEQCLLAAACRNMKKIALILARKAPLGRRSDICRLIMALIARHHAHWPFAESRAALAALKRAKKPRRKRRGLSSV